MSSLYDVISISCVCWVLYSSFCNTLFFRHLHLTIVSGPWRKITPSSAVSNSQCHGEAPLQASGGVTDDNNFKTPDKKRVTRMIEGKFFHRNLCCDPFSKPLLQDGFN